MTPHTMRPANTPCTRTHEPPRRTTPHSGYKIFHGSVLERNYTTQRDTTDSSIVHRERIQQVTVLWRYTSTLKISDNYRTPKCSTVVSPHVIAYLGRHGLLRRCFGCAFLARWGIRGSEHAQHIWTTACSCVPATNDHERHT